jgi:flagellar biosynthesis repressor protein FlbT
VSLRLTLKPGERVIIGGAVVRNGESRTELRIENEVPLLREADILSPKAANTPCSRIYLALQLMYVDPERVMQHEETYRLLVQDLLVAAPSSQSHVDSINEHLAASRYYHAIKSAKALLNYEQELLAHGA